MAGYDDTNKFELLTSIFSERGFSGLGEAMEIVLNEAMKIERSRHLGVSAYERDAQARRGYANGFKPKTVKSRIGELSLQVPQVRDSSFYPSFLEKGIRSERALSLALAEMYVQGVSTRKVDAILRDLCGLEISSMEVSRAAGLLDEEIEKWQTRTLGCYPYVFLDARYEKIREGGHVRDCAVLVAFGVREDGKRDILGSSVSLSEAEIHWRQFFESLTARGLHGIKLLISDAHSGLKAAMCAVFPSVPWQRCQFHLQQNAQSYVTYTKRKREVAESTRAIFNAEDHADALRILKRTVEKYQKDMPKLSEWMENNIPEGLTAFAFPAEHRRRLRTSNIAERTNQELKRRTKTVRIFPSTHSCHRLTSAILIETAENWISDKIYLQIQ